MKMPSRRTITHRGVPLVLVSAALMTFVARWEGHENVVYADKLAGGLPTVCKGITKHVTTQEVIVGDYWSDERCDEVESLVVSKGQLKLLDCIKAPITQSQFDAYSSFAHNVGVPAACASRALTLASMGRAKESCMALSVKPDGTPAWSYVTSYKNGVKTSVYIRGLHNRRKDETKFCLRDL